MIRIAGIVVQRTDFAHIKWFDARNTMLLRTHTAIAPWHIVKADDKRLARLNLMHDILSRLHYDGKKEKLVPPDPNLAFELTPDCIANKRLTR